MASESNGSNLLTACSLWEQTSRDGKTIYLSGTLGGLRVMIFPNKNRTRDKQPTHSLVFAAAQPRGGKQGNGQGQAKG